MRACRRALPVALALLGLLPGSASAEPTVPCTGDPGAVNRLDITIAGTPTWGLYAVPAGPPRGLVVVDHGYGHTPESWRPHLSNMARRNGVIAVAMDYRGTVDIPSSTPGGRPSARGWQIQEGAEDSIAVARLFDAQCDPPTIDLYSVSMGSGAAGLAAAASAKRVDGRPLWDYWFDIEGAVNVTETYAEASLVANSGNTFANNAKEDIEREMGGTPVERSDVYAQRTAVNRVEDMKASGLRGVVVVHGFGDGLVPYNQSLELLARLRQLGIPSDFFSVGTRGSGEPGTTLDGYVIGGIMPSPFAGHASEASDSHLVGTTGFDRLAAFFNDGQAPCDRVFLVDGDTGVVAPDPATAQPQCIVRFGAGGRQPAGSGGGGLAVASRCLGRRRLRLRLRPPRGTRIVEASVTIAGRRVRRRRGHAIRTLVVRIPTRPFRLRVLAVTADHRLIVSDRRYRACGRLTSVRTRRSRPPRRAGARFTG